MALPESGLITMSLIATEYGIAMPCTFTQLYGKPGIPASGLITFDNFYNKANTFTLNITTSVANPDVHQLALTAGWSGTSPLIVNFNCPYVNSLRLDGSKTFPAGLTLNIASGCLIGGVINSGTAIYTRIPMTINNSGTIAGGGGRGGDGQGVYVRYSSDTTNVVGYGGSGGNGQGFANTSATAPTSAASGWAGTTSTYPYDVIGGHVKPWATGGYGGYGGGWGTAGFNGQAGAYGGTYSTQGEWTPAAAGSTAGKYVDGNSYITWGTLGTRLGTFP